MSVLECDEQLIWCISCTVAQCVFEAFSAEECSMQTMYHGKTAMEVLQKISSKCCKQKSLTQDSEKILNKSFSGSQK
jgi:hypothetical protein